MGDAKRRRLLDSSFGKPKINSCCPLVEIEKMLRQWDLDMALKKPTFVTNAQLDKIANFASENGIALHMGNRILMPAVPVRYTLFL